MVDIRNYFKSTIRLVSSLTIKIDEVSKHFNYQYYIKNGLEVPALHEDKYYLNLCGMRSKIDPKVYIHDNITGEDIEITIDNVEKNPWLKKELKEYGSLFNKLCMEHPGMSTYIRGCINPINLDLLLATPANTILAYDDRLIAENELYLISEIESFVNTYMASYHNPQYLLDELYLPTLLFNLYQSITMFVITKRLENILTNKADLFHIENHLSSYKDLYSILDIYNKETRIYLYGNIRRLKTNIGKNKTITELLNSVYDRNSYGVGKLMFNRGVPEIIDEAINDYTKDFFKNEYGFTVFKANKSLYNIDGSEYKLHTVMKIEDDVGLVNDVDVFDTEFNINERYNNHFLKTELSLSETKTYMLDKPEKISTHYNNVFVSTLSNLILYLEKPQAFFYIDYINTFNHKLYKLSNKDIRDILISNLLKLYKLDTEDKVTLILSGVIREGINRDVVLNQTWHKQKNAKILDYIIGESYNLNIRGGDLAGYFEYINAVEKRIWYLMSNVNDLMIKNDIRIMSKYILTTKEIVVDVRNIEKDIGNKGLEPFCKNDVLLNNILLMEHLTQLDLRPTKTIIDRFKKLVTFFNKTTSYTVQLVYDTEFKDVFLTNTTKNNLNLGYKSLIEVKSAEWYKYEQVDYLIKSANMEADILDVKDQQINMSYRISKHGILPCISILDELSNLLMVMGSKHIRSRFYRSTPPFAYGYDDTLLDNVYNVNSSLPKQNTIKPFGVKFLDSTFISQLDKWLHVTSLPPEYFTNYVTREGGTNFVIDNNDMGTYRKDFSISLKSTNNKNNMLSVATDDIGIPSLETTTKGYNKFMSTATSLLTHILNDDIEFSSNKIQDINIKAISMLSNKHIMDTIDSNKSVLVTLITERVKRLTQIIDNVKSVHVANKDMIGTALKDRLDYGVTGVDSSSVKTLSESLYSGTLTYDVNKYLSSFKPIKNIRLTNVVDDKMVMVKTESGAETTITKYVSNSIYNSNDTISGLGYLPYTIRPMFPEKTSLVSGVNSGYVFNYDQLGITDIRTNMFMVKPILDTNINMSDLDMIETIGASYTVNRYPRKLSLSFLGHNTIGENDISYINSTNGRIYNGKREQISVYREYEFDNGALDSSPGLLLQYGTKTIVASEYGLDKKIRNYNSEKQLNVNMLNVNNVVTIDKITTHPVISTSKRLLPFSTKATANSSKVLLDKSYVRLLDNEKDVDLSKKEVIDNKIYSVTNDINNLVVLPYTIDYGKQYNTSLIPMLSGDIVVRDMVSIHSKDIDIRNSKIMVDSSVYSDVGGINESIQTYTAYNYPKFMRTNGTANDVTYGTDGLLSVGTTTILKQDTTTKDNKISSLATILTPITLTPVAQYLGKQDKTSLISGISNSATPLDKLYIKDTNVNIVDVVKHMMETNIGTVTEEVDKLKLISSIRNYSKFFNPISGTKSNIVTGDLDINESNLTRPSIRKKELAKMLTMVEDFEETVVLSLSGELLPYSTVGGYRRNISISGSNRISVLKDTDLTVLDLLSTSSFNRQRVYSTTNEFSDDKVLSSSKDIIGMGSTDVDSTVVVNDGVLHNRTSDKEVMLDTSKAVTQSLYNVGEDSFKNNEVVASATNLLEYGSFLSTNRTMVVYDKAINNFVIKEVVNVSIKTRNSLVTALEDVNMSPSLVSSLYGNVPYGNEVYPTNETLDLANDINKFSNYVVPFNIKSNTGFKTFSLEEDIFSNRPIVYNSVNKLRKTSLIDVMSDSYLINGSQMLISSKELELATNTNVNSLLTSQSDDLVTIRPSYNRLGYMHSYRVGNIMSDNIKDGSITIQQQSSYIRAKILSDLSVSSIYDTTNVTSVISAIESKYYKELSSTIDKVTTEFIVNNKDLSYLDSNYGFNIKGNSSFPVYSEIEDLNNLNYGYVVDTYMEKGRTNSVDNVSPAKDDEVSMEVEIITKNRSYNPTVVEVESEDIEMDLTFEIKTK